MFGISRLQVRVYLVLLVLKYSNAFKFDVQAFSWMVIENFPFLNCDQYACQEDSCTARCLPSTQRSFPPPSPLLVSEANEKIHGYQFQGFPFIINIITSERQPTEFYDYWLLQCVVVRESPSDGVSIWSVLLYVFTVGSSLHYLYLLVVLFKRYRLLPENWNILGYNSYRLSERLNISIPVPDYMSIERDVDNSVQLDSGS